MIAEKPNRAYLSETEAAEALGLSIDSLRDLVRLHIAGADTDTTNLAAAHYQPADMLILRLLLSQPSFAKPQS